MARAYPGHQIRPTTAGLKWALKTQLKSVYRKTVIYLNYSKIKIMFVTTISRNNRSIHKVVLPFRYLRPTYKNMHVCHCSNKTPPLPSEADENGPSSEF